jgi:uncharacterized membrane protein YfcA
MDLFLECLLLIPVGFLAGFINTVAGGGTLFTLPALIFMGLPAPVANGTNRIAIFVQTVTAVRGFKSQGASMYPFSLYLGISALVGSLIGAKLAINVDDVVFNRILAGIMLTMLVFMLFNKQTDFKNLQPKLTGAPLYKAIVIFFFLGIYGGFINAGIGFFMLLILPYINGLSLLQSNVTKVFVVAIYTIGAIVIFALENKINYRLAFILTIGNALGAWFSSRWSVKKDDKVIRIFMMVTILALSIKLWFF